ncbi:hypothetical protein, partial [Escherichia coli]|uniref:hypothetical protein n=1 Tax=Escherichia coli TaxID=562 RepID=UPI001827FAA2
LVVVVSAVAATAAYLAFGSPWHVLAGAIAGMAAAVLAYREDAAPEAGVSKDLAPKGVASTDLAS